jgi:hypothetical protein
MLYWRIKEYDIERYDIMENEQLMCRTVVLWMVCSTENCHAGRWAMIQTVVVQDCSAVDGVQHTELWCGRWAMIQTVVQDCSAVDGVQHTELWCRSVGDDTNSTGNSRNCSGGSLIALRNYRVVQFTSGYVTANWLPWPGTLQTAMGRDTRTCEIQN